MTRPALGYIELSSARRPTMRLKVVNAICGERGADMAESDGAKWGHKGADPKAWSESCAYYEAVLVAAKEAVADSRNARHLATLRRELRRRQSDPKTPRSV